MHLIEVLVAGSVFAIASGSSLQQWSATAARLHQLTGREQLEQQIEQDRLLLMALWRRSAQTTAANDAVPPSTGCAATAAELLAMAGNRPAQTSLQRTIQLSSEGGALQIHWRASGDAVVQRRRLVTPAGLGLCDLPAENAAQPEQLQPTPPAQSPSGSPPQPQTQPGEDSLLTDSEVEGVAG